jgi:hypothetical protein
MFFLLGVLACSQILSLEIPILEHWQWTQIEKI